jgi:mycothiol synthase
VPRVDLFHQPNDQWVNRLGPLLRQVESSTGDRALPDHHWLELHASEPLSGFVGAVVWDEADPHVPRAYAQVAMIAGTASLEVIVHPDAADHAALVLHAAIGAISGEDEVEVHWWVHGEPAWQRAEAAGLCLTAGRVLLQMRCPLPLSAPHHVAAVATRAFDTADAERWVELNNRAFAGHGEQGSWSVDDLRRRMAETWFDPAGFLLHERDGRLAGFCWTKVHATVPPLGEIYVIAVDPDFTGLGLGRALTVAGLASLADRGLRHGMLYVDAHNVAAVGLYRSLGFTVERSDHVFSGRLGQVRSALGIGARR